MEKSGTNPQNPESGDEVPTLVKNQVRRFTALGQPMRVFNLEPLIDPDLPVEVMKAIEKGLIKTKVVFGFDGIVSDGKIDGFGRTFFIVPLDDPRPEYKETKE